MKKKEANVHESPARTCSVPPGSSIIVSRLFSSRRRRLFYLVRVRVYTRNVINEHTRELSQTMAKGEQKGREREREKTKDIQ